MSHSETRSRLFAEFLVDFKFSGSLGLISNFETITCDYALLGVHVGHSVQYLAKNDLM